MTDSLEEQELKTEELATETTEQTEQTAGDSAEEKQARLERNQQIMRDLIEQFPNALSAEKENVKPLMIGVTIEIMNRCGDRFDFKDLKRLIGRYCTAIHYLKAVIKQTHRVDLDGNPIQEIPEAHKKFAAKKLGEIRQKIEGKPVDDTKAALKAEKKAAHELRQKAEMEAAAQRRAEKAAAKKAEKEAAALVEKETVAPVKVAAVKKEESKPATVVVKAKKTEPTPTTVVIKTKKPESAPISTPTATESESGEPVRKKLSLKSKA